MKALQNEEPRSRLGRGLAALIGDSGNETDAVVRARGQKRIPIEFLRANPLNPRTLFDEDDLAELTASIREKGIIQPILVRTVPGVADAYEIIAGERRWRAAQQAELHDVPIVLIEADDKQALEIAIIENVQRSNLNALEEAQGYERLSNDFGYTQGDLARVIGKSRPHVSNTMRLLKLPQETRDMIASGRISAGHGRALLGAEDPNALAKRIVVAQPLRPRGRGTRQARGRDASRRCTPFGAGEGCRHPRARKAYRRAHRLTVDIRHQGDAGEVRVRYQSLDQLDSLVALLGG